MPPSHYQLHAAAVQDVIDGEAVIIQLETGNYFSLDSTGALIWQALVAGHSSASISAALQARFPDQAVQTDVDRLLAQLLEAGLLVRCDAGGASPALQLPAALAYAAPQLHTYTDMQDLLLLDPIHDVDQRGWPNADAGDAA